MDISTQEAGIKLEDLLMIAELIVQHSDGRAELICQKSYEQDVADTHFIIVDGYKIGSGSLEYIIARGPWGWKTAFQQLFNVDIGCLKIFKLEKSYGAVKQPLKNLFEKIFTDDEGDDYDRGAFRRHFRDMIG